VNPVLAILEHDRGELHPAALEALTVGRRLATQMRVPMHAAVVGGTAGDVARLAEIAGSYGAAVVHHATSALIVDYGPDAWGEALTQLTRAIEPVAVLTVGTDRGNEVMAQLAARLDLPFVANCISLEPGDHEQSWNATRTQWGGSLLEDLALTADIALVTFARHSVEPNPEVSGGGPSAPSEADPYGSTVVSSVAAAAGSVRVFAVELDDAVLHTMIVDRVPAESGESLATAPVVVGGGRGVGSEEGFGPIEDLAELLGGRVGCSRAVTNNGWRSHSDQVGQTGTRIAPELYIACGISGAIQHWVGAMASQNILAINTDPEANIVSKAGYAIIADLHEVVPAIVAEIRRRVQPSDDVTGHI